MVKDHRHQELDVVPEDRSLSREASADQQAGDAPNVFKWIHVLALIGLCTLLLLGVYHGTSRRRLTKKNKDEEQGAKDSRVDISKQAYANEASTQALAIEGEVNNAAKIAQAGANDAHNAQVAKKSRAESDRLEQEVRNQAAKPVKSVRDIEKGTCTMLCITKGAEEPHCVGKKDETHFKTIKVCSTDTFGNKDDKDCKGGMWAFTTSPTKAQQTNKYTVSYATKKAGKLTEVGMKWDNAKRSWSGADGKQYTMECSNQ